VSAGGFPRATVAGLVALVALELLWETLLAPTGGGWLAFKALTLALLLPGVMRGARKPRQVARAAAAVLRRGRHRARVE
jgi:uncharacterized membrane protein